MAKEEDHGSDQLKHYENSGFGTYPESHTDHRSPVRMVVPEEPPELSLAAARALLRMIRKAYAQRLAQGEPPSNGRDGESDGTDCG
jgi:hypothetical protein